MADRKSENEKSDLVAQFGAVTGLTDLARGRFFLEAAGWNLDVAVTSFFDDPEMDPDGEQEIIEQVPPPREPTPPRGQAGRGGQAKPRAPPQSNSRFASLSTLRRDESSSSEEEGEAYYAGGSERGAGQQIIGQPKKKDAGRIVENMFKAAKERGAEVVDPSEEGASSGRLGGGLFQGMAYRLGDTVGAPSMQVGSGASAASATGSGRRQVDVMLHMWRNGFSLDSGPLRDYQSDENAQFLDSIRNGEIPRELIKDAQGAQVSLSLNDHRTEDYVQPKKPAIKSFSGMGHRLGSPTNGATVPAAAAAVTPEVAASQLSGAALSVNASINFSAPMTSLQIRLTDGSRLVQKFNTTHTISDVRRYISAARPEFAATSWTLMTTFPNKTLTDETLTLGAAGLLNAVLVLSPNK